MIDRQLSVRLFSANRTPWMLAGAALALVAVGWWAIVLHRLPSRPMRIAIVNSPPFESMGADGQPHGFSVELVGEAARRSGIPLQWVLSPPFPEKLLPASQVDLWATLSVTPERQRLFHLTEPYLRNEFCLIGRGAPSGPGPSASGQWTTSPVDTARRTVSVPDSPVRERQARRLMPLAHLISNPTREGVAQDVCTGKADYGFLEVRVAYSSALRRQPGCETQNFEIIPLRDAVRSGLDSPAPFGGMAARQQFHGIAYSAILHSPIGHKST